MLVVLVVASLLDLCQAGTRPSAKRLISRFQSKPRQRKNLKCTQPITISGKSIREVYIQDNGTSYKTGYTQSTHSYHESTRLWITDVWFFTFLDCGNTIHSTILYLWYIMENKISLYMFDHRYFVPNFIHCLTDFRQVNLERYINQSLLCSVNLIIFFLAW